MELPFGLKLSRADSTPTTLFGGERIAVLEKMADMPPGARIDQAGTEMLAQLSGSAPAQALGTTMPAIGVRPNPGVLPEATDESLAQLLRYAIPWGGNIGYTPRSGYGTPFTMLRGLAATSPIIALCIQARKDQIAAMEWDFAFKDKTKKGTDVESKLEKARKLFEKPDGVLPLKTWLQVLVDEMLTVDAVSIFKSPTVKGAIAQLAAQEKRQRYQLKGDEIVGYDVIDGTTIKVLIDGRGKVPVAPNIGYRQIIFGQPVSGGDCTTDQLMYRPKTVRTWTPYGMSPIEAALLIVTTDLNRIMFQLAYYTEGNIPEAMVGVPDNWTATQAAKWQTYWDILLKGDPSNRSRMKFVPAAMAKAVHEFKKADFTTAFDLWLLKIQCACFGVTPTEIGFTDDVNKATSKTQGDVNTRRSAKPTANYLKSILDEILVEQGLGDLEATWSSGEGEDALSQARIIDLKLRSGRMSLDEVRAHDGNPTLGVGPAVISAAGTIMFWDQAILQAEAAGLDDTEGDPNAALPEADENDVDPEAKPSNATPTKTGDDGKTEAAKQALLSDLRKWKAVATRAIEEGKALPTFKSAIVGPMLRRNIERMLDKAATRDEVARIFKLARERVEKAQKFSKGQAKAEKKMASALTSTLESMGKAFAKHAAAAVEKA